MLPALYLPELLKNDNCNAHPFKKSDEQQNTAASLNFLLLFHPNPEQPSSPTPISKRQKGPDVNGWSKGEVGLGMEYVLVNSQSEELDLASNSCDIWLKWGEGPSEIL